MLDQKAPPRARTLMWHLQKPIFYTQHFFEMRNSEFRIRNSEFRIEKFDGP